ncbi:MAG TPA: hypothetical protein VHN81_01670, partial [Edaphobacter sp.]|nr:hypothetical protein [Edaphobacter sp.]
HQHSNSRDRMLKLHVAIHNIVSDAAGKWERVSEKQDEGGEDSKPDREGCVVSHKLYVTLNPVGRYSP